MSVRPFYISADIEGRKTMLTGGPRKSDGYMHVEITQRNRVKLRQHLTLEVLRRVINLSLEYMIVAELVWQHMRPITNK